MSIPVAHNQHLKDSYRAWRDKIVDEKKHPSHIDRIFLRPDILHFTLLMLPLPDAEAVKKAQEVLESVAPKIKEIVEKETKTGQLMIHFEGLDHFGSKENTRVIYQKIDEANSDLKAIRQIANIVV